MAKQRPTSGAQNPQVANTIGNLFKSLGASAGFARFKAALVNLNKAAKAAAAGATPAAAAFKKIGPALSSAAGMVPGVGALFSIATKGFSALIDLGGNLLSLAAQKGGGAGVSQAFESLAEVLGTVLLPVMTAVGGAILTLVDVMWGALQPVLGQIFQTILSAVVPAAAMLIGVLFKMAKVFLGNVMPAVATVVNFTYKFGVALVAIFQPVFDFLTAGWRILGGFLMDVFDAVLTAGQALGTGLGFVVRTIGEAIDFITGGMFGADVKKAGADMMAVMIAGMAKPVLPMGGGPAAPVLDPGMFRAMADVIPDIGEAGGLEDITGKMIDGMIRALGETELARFGNQGGFKGIADAWKSAQMAAFRSPEEARRDKMFLEGLKNMREILVTLKEGLGGPGMME